MIANDQKMVEAKIKGPTIEAVEELVERASWGNKVEFLLTIIGLAIGLGNVWRFPYLCYSNGGGAFLIPYFGTLFLVGIPIFLLELSLGQFPSRDALAAWSVSPLFKGVGFAVLTINTLISFYYNIILSWVVYYLFASMTSKLPWTDCGNTWNTERCCKFGDGAFNLSVANASGEGVTCKSPAEEYFFRKVLKISDGIEEQGTIIWELALCHLLVWLIVFLVLIKGIKSLGKVVYFSTIFPYVLLTVMLVRGLTLDGAYDGIVYYIKPTFSKLAHGKTWSDAVTQIFFSLSVCQGGMITFSSFNPFKNNVLRDSIMVPMINCLTSFYGGFAIFSMLGYMAKQKNVHINQVVQEGPGLVFVVYPETLTTMPVAPLWSILFFLMMLNLGFSTQFSLAETTLSSFVDNIPALRRSKLRLIIFRACGCATLFLLGLVMVTNGGFYVFSIVDGSLGIPLLVAGIMEFVTIQYVYGYNNFAYDIEMMLGKKPSLFFKITWCFLSPVVLLVVTITLLIQYKIPVIHNKPLPLWGAGIGWMVVALALFMIPSWFVFYFFKNGGWQLMKKVSLPTEDWGPALEKNRIGKYARSKPNGNNFCNHAEANHFDDDLKLGIENETFKESDAF